MSMTEFVERELSNVWNKYISNDVSVWDRMYALDYRGKLESTDQRARHYIITGILSELKTAQPAILDVGCGCGTTCHFLDHKRVRYVGIDHSTAAIQQAKQAFPSASFEVTNFDGYKAATTFDAVLFNEVLYYLPVAAIAPTLKKATTLLAGEESLLVVSMSDNPKARLLWNHCRFLGEPVHDIGVRSRVHSSRWTVRAWKLGVKAASSRPS